MVNAPLRIQIDCGPMPPIGIFGNHPGLRLDKHAPAGQVLLEFRPGQRLYLNDQRIVVYKPQDVRGLRLRDLAVERSLNACLFYALKLHPDLVPGELKVGVVYCTATTLRTKSGIHLPSFRWNARTGCPEISCLWDGEDVTAQDGIVTLEAA